MGVPSFSAPYAALSTRASSAPADWAGCARPSIGALLRHAAPASAAQAATVPNKRMVGVMGSPLPSQTFSNRNDERVARPGLRSIGHRDLNGVRGAVPRDFASACDGADDERHVEPDQVALRGA